MSDKPLNQLLEDLPQSSITTRLLHMLDYVVPGEWRNITSFEEMIKDVTGESDQGLIQQVGERAIMLYNDPENGYQRAVWIYRTLDDTQDFTGLAALADKLSHSFEFLSFLDKVTPKADTAQAIDAGVKLLGELCAFCYVNGLPGDSVSDFAAAFVNSQREDSMRLASFLAFDCVLPLGPDFMAKLTESIEGLSFGVLGENSRFAKLARFLPDDNPMKAGQLLMANFDATKDSIAKFAVDKGIEQQSLLGKVKDVLGDVDDKLDFVAAGIDLVSNHFEHTGIQSVTRRIISRAYGEI